LEEKRSSMRGMKRQEEGTRKVGGGAVGRAGGRAGRKAGKEAR
jgi:hypothetical protein